MKIEFSGGRHQDVRLPSCSMNSAYSLPAEPASVAAARRYADEVLSAWGVGDASWTCLQLISELATNAVIHARTEFTLKLSCHENTLWRVGSARVMANTGATDRAVEHLAPALPAIDAAPPWSENFVRLLHTAAEVHWLADRSDHAAMLERNVRDKALVPTSAIP
jgi:hypothetical protein